MNDELDSLTYQQSLRSIEEKLDRIIGHLDDMLRVLPEPREKSHRDQEVNDRH